MTESSSTPAKMKTVTSAKIDVEKFDGRNNFSLWQFEVLDGLCQQDQGVALEKMKSVKMDDKEWERINRQACGTICSCLCREQKYPFMRETSESKLWKALENKYMKKSNENWLYLKKRLFCLQLKPVTTIGDHIDTFN